MFERVFALDSQCTLAGFAIQIYLLAAGQTVVILHLGGLIERLFDDFFSPPRIGCRALTIVGAAGGELENGGRRRRRRGVDEWIIGTVRFRRGVVTE